jgi:hypothetical protein
MMDFPTATTVYGRAEEGFAWEVPDGWQQGRGAWGGLVVGALLRAVEASEPEDGRSVRSIAAHLVAPAIVGPHRIETTLVRRGSAVTTWQARLTDGSGSVVATATVLLGASRSLADAPDASAWSMLVPPAAPGPDAVPRLEFGPPLGPAFFQHLDARVVTGILGGSGLPEAVGWIDYVRPFAPTAASLLALVDGWWPASLNAMPAWRPIATISFAANLVIDPSTVTGPLLHHSLVTAAADGYTSEHRRLWTSDGRLAVDNLQSIAIIA